MFLKHQDFYNEEFDPGSGWTLAAGLTHASCGAARLRMVATGARVRNAYVTYPLQGNSPRKLGLIPHSIINSHEFIIKATAVKDGHAWH